MINKDFLRDIFANRKRLLKLSQLRAVHVPKYDELCVKNVWSRIQSDDSLRVFFPNKFPKGRQPDRTYVFNVLNTIQPKYVAEIISHAHKQRHAVTDQTDHNNEILVCEEW